MGPEELGAMSANIKSLCDRVAHQSRQIDDLTKDLKTLSEQMIANKSGLKGFKMGLATALIFLGGGAGASMASFIEKVWK